MTWLSVAAQVGGVVVAAGFVGELLARFFGGHDDDRKKGGLYGTA